MSVHLIRTLPDLESACRHGVENPTLEAGDYYLHPDDEYELDPIRIKPTTYDALMHLDPWMAFGTSDVGL